MLGPKDRFSGMKDPLKQIGRMLPLGLRMIAMPLIRRKLARFGIEMNPKRLRQRHADRLNKFAAAGQSLRMK